METLNLIISNIDTLAVLIAGVYGSIQLFRNKQTKEGLHSLLRVIGDFNDSSLADEIYKSNNKVVEKELPKSGAKVIDKDS